MFFRDKPFFDTVVKRFIQNKMEKSFIDWYLLAKDAKETNQFVYNITEFIDVESRIESLNFVEQCLMIEICLEKGTDEQKAKATSIAKFMIASHRKRTDQIDPNERNRIFDLVLSMTTLDKEQNLNLNDIQEELEELSSY